MAIALSRAIYTQHKRSKHDFPFSIASTAMSPYHNEDDAESIDFQENGVTDEKKQIIVTSTEKASQLTVPDTRHESLAALPQYIAQECTTLIMRESFPPLRHGCFDVSNASGEALFKVEREFPSFSRRRHIIDVKTESPLLTVRRDVGSLPRSYYLEDPNENKVLELQGKYNVPFQGRRSVAAFIDAISCQKIELLVQGSWLNRDVEVVERNTGRVIARADREVLSLRNAVGGRTTYTATVEAGIDMVIVIGLIMAVDARADA